MVFDQSARVAAVAQKEHEQIFQNRVGWSTIRWKSYAARKK